jgi:hypothetical protein
MDVTGQLHAPAALPSEKSPRYPLDRRLGGSESRPRRCDKEKKVPEPAGNVMPVVQPVA